MTVDVSTHVEGLRASLAELVDQAHRADLEALCPTAPNWTLREMLAHLGMVHRWSDASLTGRRVDPQAMEREGMAAPDPVRWLHDGALHLLRTIDQAPTDLDAPVFLEDAPAPRAFWTRRQCHETTIHAVDALAAALGRVPIAWEASWISREIAVDGIDELLTGFAPRRSFGLRTETPTRFAVRPNDVQSRWLVHAGPDPVVTDRDSDEDGDVVLEGSAVQLYLALWNRTDEIQVEGFEQWRRLAQITWA